MHRIEVDAVRLRSGVNTSRYNLASKFSGGLALLTLGTTLLVPLSAVAAPVRLGGFNLTGDCQWFYSDPAAYARQLDPADPYTWRCVSSNQDFSMDLNRFAVHEYGEGAYAVLEGQYWSAYRDDGTAQRTEPIHSPPPISGQSPIYAEQFTDLGGDKNRMKTTAQLSRGTSPRIDADTHIWTGDDWVGYTGGVFVLFLDANGNVIGSTIQHRFGVNGQQVPGAPSDRTVHWAEAVRPNVANRTAGLVIVHEYAPKGRSLATLGEVCEVAAMFGFNCEDTAAAVAATAGG